MSEDKLPEPVTLNWVGVRILTINSELRDLKRRFTGLEARLTGLEARLGAIEVRFGALETRYATQEDRLTAMLDLLVRVAARVGVGEPGPPPAS
jgi:uncharacterized coiled-coil protein SlyX